MPVVTIPKPSVIVCDIEGTTTSIRFWSEVLSPFVTQYVSACLREWWSKPETQDVVTLLRKSSMREWLKGNHEVPLIEHQNRPIEDVIESVAKNVEYQLVKARSNDPLKSVILLVWLYGYTKNSLKGHVYPDVMVAFRQWKETHSIRVFTYASGSSLTQQMLLCNTVSGNLRPLVDGYLDTESVGKKTSHLSYFKLPVIINKSRARIVFLSDNLQELKAATCAGIKSILVIRSHNEQLLDNKDKLDYPFIRNFEELQFEA